MEPLLEAVVKAAWAEPSVKALMDPLLSGKILEVGFGSGYCAKRIEVARPKQHIIIEADPATAERAVKWAGSNPRISILEDSWESALDVLGVFDALFFNLSQPLAPLDPKAVRETGHLLVKQGKELLAKVHEELPQLAKTRYSDADLDYFFTQIGTHMGKEKAKFIQDLRDNGQISEEQYDKITTKYHLEKKEAAPLKPAENKKDSLLAFLEACLAKHTRKGSRIFCFFSSPLSQYENPQFFEKIITNPHVEYQEKLVTTEPTKTHPGGEVLVGIVERLH